MNEEQRKLYKITKAVENPAEFAYEETERLDKRIDVVDEKIDSTKEELENKISNIELTPGEKGENGSDGKDGLNGKDGKDGLNGKDGKDGVNGLDGIDGKDGKDGKDGEKGEKGDKPNHKWDGTKLMFEKPDGTWGAAVDLIGKDGKVVPFFGGASSNLQIKNNGVTLPGLANYLDFKGTAISSITGDNNGTYTITINATDIAAVWGGITGTITNQTDLTSYLSTNYVPYTGANANVNLGVYNLKTSQTSLGTTATDGFILENATAATVGATVQISPRTRWNGSALATGVNTSQTYDFAVDNLPISQATNIDGEWRLRSSRNGAAYVERFGVKTEGNDTKLKVGGVNYFGKSGNQNDFYSGTTSLRFLKNDASIIYMTISNTDGTTTLSPSTLTGSAATAALSMTQTWNTSGSPDLITANVTNTASDVLSNLINLKVNTLSKFKITRRGVMTLADDVINPSFNITGVSGNTMAFAADSAGGYVGSVNNIPFRVLIRNGVLTPAVFGTNGDIGIGNNITNFTTMAGSYMAIKSGNIGVNTVSPNITGFSSSHRVMTILGVGGTYGHHELSSSSATLTDDAFLGSFNFGNATKTVARLLAKSSGTAGDAGDLVIYTSLAGTLAEKFRFTAAGLMTMFGKTSASPALKRNGTKIDVRLGDDSAYTGMEMQNLVIRSAGNQSIIWQGSSTLSGASNGNMLMMNNAGTGFNMIQMGGVSNLFAGLKLSGAALESRLADDSGYAPFTAEKVTSSTTLVTADPSSGSGAWKLGTLQSTTTSFDDSGYIEIDIDGSIYKLALAK